MKPAVGLRSIAISVPSVQRTNAYFRRTRPQLVADAEQAALARLWKKVQDAPAGAFDVEMEPYLSDPFRGTIHRRLLGPDETPLTLELRAARSALAAASLAPSDLGCILVSSFLPDSVGIGNSAFLSGALGFKGAAWNIESACTSAVTALQTAVALVRAGEYKNVLIVTSCTYSRVSDETDTIMWFLGDGAGALVVSAVPEGQGVLGMKIVNTALTCNTFYYDIYTPENEKPKIRISAHGRTGRVLRDVSEPYFLECCDGALEDAGMTRKDVDFLCVNTPTAWYAKFCAKAFGISPERTIDTYPIYANIGPALMPVNLYHAAESGRIKPGDVVLVYTIGSVASAGAAVMRWGDVGRGPLPPAPASVD